MHAFLAHVEQERGCLPQTRNQRLSAVRTRFVASRDPEQFDRTSQVRAIPLKKTAQQPVAYLEKPEIEALPTVPDPARLHGRREHALLLFLYDTGARVSETAQLRVGDLHLGDRAAAAATLRGQGGKTRQCPLWPRTARLLEELVAGRSVREPVFLSRQRRSFTRFGIRALVRRRWGSGRWPACTRRAGLRRVYLRGHSNMLKRLLVPVSACNLGVLMRSLTGTGTPRSLQGHRLAAVFAPERLGNALLETLRELLRARRNLRPGFRLSSHPESGLYAA